MVKEDFDDKIHFIAKTTLGGLKGVFVENNLDDREATLSLMYFMEVFVRLGWKGSSPIDVLENLIQVMRSREHGNKN